MAILKKDEKGSFLSNIPPLGPPLMASQESFLEVVEGLAIARQVSDNLLSETMCLNSLCYFKVVLFIFFFKVWRSTNVPCKTNNYFRV